ncbi:MAG: hypothetical protein QG553_180 [Patescibacteria group bacterium]|nr:hypothetical protein [Patescibacteria group bacterium]
MPSPSPERKWYQSGRVFGWLLTLGVTCGVVGAVYSDEIAEALTHEPANPAIIADYEPYSVEEPVQDLVEVGFNMFTAASLTAAAAILIKQTRQELE